MTPTDRPDTERSIRLRRTGKARFEAVNSRGTVLPMGSGDEPDFTPIELLLVALAGCTAIDVDLITGKRAEPERLDVIARGDKVRDELGNHMTGLRLTFDVAFPVGEDGDRAREVLPRTLERVHDRVCTVVRTIELGEPVEFVVPMPAP